jgi:hypothetical protein
MTQLQRLQPAIHWSFMTATYKFRTFAASCCATDQKIQQCQQMLFDLIEKYLYKSDFKVAVLRCCPALRNAALCGCKFYPHKQ